MGKHFNVLAAAALALFVAACGDKSGNSGSGANAPPLLTAATLGEQTVLKTPEYLAQSPYRDADQSNGARQAQICRACHSLDEGGPHMIGPALYGFFGERAASRQGFDYSQVLKDADFVWTPRALDAWLAQPGRFMPGNRMTFAGVLSQSDRDDLVAYLLLETTNGAGRE